MNPSQTIIGVVPLGDLSELPLKIIAANIATHYKLSVTILPSLENPDFAFDNKRGQYNAGAILKALESLSFNNCHKIIGIVNQDIFVPIFTHVYGEARQGAKVALVSLFRLSKNPDGSFPPSSLFYERAAKVALHELGHLFNLFHCDDIRCLMHFSGDIDDLDNCPFYLCSYCSVFFSG